MLTLCGSFYLFGLVQLVLAGIAGLSADMTRDGDVLAVELPQFVELEVVETEPGVKGDTAQGGTKPARLGPGAVVQVPLFIDVGDVIKVDRTAHKYLERVTR